MSKNALITSALIIVLLISGLVTAAFLGRQGSREGDADSDPTSTVIPTAAATPARTVFKIFLVDLEDGGEMGEEIGCGDSIVSVERSVGKTDTPLQVAIEELLSANGQLVSQAGLYNALSQSDLALESAVINESGLATIRLSGELTLGGVCDNPRVEEQLYRTALQFESVEEVEIFINGEPLEEVLSGN